MSGNTNVDDIFSLLNITNDESKESNDPLNNLIRDHNSSQEFIEPKKNKHTHHDNSWIGSEKESQLLTISALEKLEDADTNSVGLYQEYDALSEDLKNKIITKKVSVNIHNIISSASVDIEVDLKLMAVSIRNAEYNPKKVNTLIIRLKKPNCTALIFRNGRIMLTGTKNAKDALDGCKKIAKLIKRVTNTNIKLKNFKIENIIASAHCNIPVRLENLAQDHKGYCNYEPELFAGLVYRYKPSTKLKAVILIFVSGKIIITGCKSEKMLYSVFQDIYNVLIQYKS